jgi:hypothetical protein
MLVRPALQKKAGANIEETLKRAQVVRLHDSPKSRGIVVFASCRAEAEEPGIRSDPLITHPGATKLTVKVCEHKRGVPAG